jgi:hypothetical protein
VRTAAVSDIAKDYRVDLVWIGAKMRYRCFGRKLLSVFSEAEYLSALAHAARAHFGVTETTDMRRVRRAVTLRYEQLELLSHYLAGRVAEDRFGTLVEKNYSLKLIDADDCIRRDRNDPCEHSVGYRCPDLIG